MLLKKLTAIIEFLFPEEVFLVASIWLYQKKLL